MFVEGKDILSCKEYILEILTLGNDTNMPKTQLVHVVEAVVDIQPCGLTAIVLE